MPKPFMPFEELKELLQTRKDALDFEIAAIEIEFPDARGLGPMTLAESRESLLNLFAIAAKRPLTTEEAFIGQQLVASHEIAIASDTLGYKGRWLSVKEDVVLGRQPL